MKYPFRFAAFGAVLIFATACSQSQTPASPSRVSSVAEPGAASSLSSLPWNTMAQNTQAQVVDWACLTTGAGCAVLPLPIGTGEDAPSAPPTNLAFTVSGSTVVLTWSPPGAGSVATSYLLQAGSSAGLSNIVSFNTGSFATTFTATNVPSGTYFVRVRAANNDGTGPASNEVTIVVGSAPCPPPGAPTGLVGSASGSTVLLQWNGVSGAIAFIIEAGSSPGASNLASFDTGSAATSFSATAPNGTYYIRIRVRTSCGTSGTSNEVTVTVGSAPPPPGGGLTGLWSGTITPRLTGTQQVDFVESGTSLTGTVRNRPAGAGITFQLTKHPVTLALYTGNLIFEGTGGGACGAGAHAGELRFTTGPSRLLGTFTLPASGGCAAQTNTVDLLKQ